MKNTPKINSVTLYPFHNNIVLPRKIGNIVVLPSKPTISSKYNPKLIIDNYIMKFYAGLSDYNLICNVNNFKDFLKIASSFYEKKYTEYPNIHQFILMILKNHRMNYDEVIYNNTYHYHFDVDSLVQNIKKSLIWMNFNYKDFFLYTEGRGSNETLNEKIKLTLSILDDADTGYYPNTLLTFFVSLFVKFDIKKDKYTNDDFDIAFKKYITENNINLDGEIPVNYFINQIF